MWLQRGLTDSPPNAGRADHCRGNGDTAHHADADPHCNTDGRAHGHSATHAGPHCNTGHHGDAGPHGDTGTDRAAGPRVGEADRHDPAVPGEHG